MMLFHVFFLFICCLSHMKDLREPLQAPCSHSATSNRTCRLWSQFIGKKYELEWCSCWHRVKPDLVQALVRFLTDIQVMQSEPQTHSIIEKNDVIFQFGISWLSFFPLCFISIMILTSIKHKTTFMWSFLWFFFKQTSGFYVTFISVLGLLISVPVS